MTDEELRNGLCTAPFDHKQKVMALRVEHDGHIAMPFAGACFVNHKTAHLAPVLGHMGLHDIMLKHSPEPFVALSQVAGRRRHAHLLTQQQDHGLHH